MFRKKKEQPYKNSTLIVYLILRAFVIFALIHNVYLKQWLNVFLCVLTLFLLVLPSIIARHIQIEFPTVLEISVLIFIFAAEILGSMSNFYGKFAHWDTMLHTISGFISTGIGFAIIDILNDQDNFLFKLSPKFVAIVGFCFSMTIGVLWEFGEYFMDKYFFFDGQKDKVVQKIASWQLSDPQGSEVKILHQILKTQIIYIDETGQQQVIIVEDGYLDIGLNDTMKDLFVNMLGSIVYSIFGWLYLENRHRYRFAGSFIPKRISSNE